MKVYLAGPLFSEAEQNWLGALKKEMQAAGYEVVWPFELFTQAQIAAWGKDAPAKIMAGCKNSLDGCDMVVALLDGSQVDDGTAWELGYAFAKGIPLLGIRTDARYGGEVPCAKVNAMIAASCEHMAGDRRELLAWLLQNHPPRA